MDLFYIHTVKVKKKFILQKLYYYFTFGKSRTNFSDLQSNLSQARFQASIMPIKTKYMFGPIPRFMNLNYPLLPRQHS